MCGEAQISNSVLSFNFVIYFNVEYLCHYSRQTDKQSSFGQTGETENDVDTERGLSLSLSGASITTPDANVETAGTHLNLSLCWYRLNGVLACAGTPGEVGLNYRLGHSADSMLGNVADVALHWIGAVPPVPLSVRGWSMAGSENRANNIQIGAWGISTRTAPRLITLDLSRYTTAAEYVEKSWSEFRFSSRSFTMIREIWARILVQVTVYRRLRIDWDQMAISTNPKPTIMTRYIVTCTRPRALVIQYTIVLSIRSWAWHNGDNAFSRRLYPVWY